MSMIRNFFAFLIPIMSLSFGWVETGHTQPTFYGILSPMPSEAIPIIGQLQNIKVSTINKVTYTIGNLADKQIVIANSGMGKVNAAIVTYALITRFHPKIIILSGVAGGVNPDLHVGDVTIGTTVYSMELDNATPITSTKPDDISPINHHVVLQKFNPHPLFARLIQTVTLPKRDFKVTPALIATSDSLPASELTIARLKHDHADSIEMEGSAFTQVCWLFDTPCLVIRSVVNGMDINLAADAGKASFALADDALKRAAKNAADITVEVIKLL